MSPGLSAPRPRRGRPAGLAAAFVALVCLAFPALVAAQTGGQCMDARSDPGICLLDDRFKVTVEWADFSGNPFTVPSNLDSGQGQGVVVAPSTPTASTDAGYFYFHSEENIELVVKMVDGRSDNGHFWFFAGSLTNVEYTIRVVDTDTDREAEYKNPPREFTTFADTEAFPEITPQSRELSAAPSAPPSHGLFQEQAVILPAGSLPSCAEPAVACVQDGRFAVETLVDPMDGAPARQGVPILTTETSALFELFPDNGAEAAVKVVDGRASNDEFWFFASGFAVTGLEVRVTDLQTGKAHAYKSPEGEGLVVADRQPFAPDPPPGPFLETSELPGFQFKVRVTGGGGEIRTRQEADCIPETLCISGAVEGRSELFLRIVGPKPNGFLQPNVVKFSTSQIEVWIEQLSTGLVNYYVLDGATPGSSDLTGFFDRFGFGPG